MIYHIKGQSASPFLTTQRLIENTLATLRIFIYISICFLCIVLGSCNVRKGQSHNQQPDAQKLISAQILNNDSVHQYALSKGFGYKNTNDSLSLPTSAELPLISIKSISHKIDFHAKRIKFTELPLLLQSRLNKMTSLHTNIAEEGAPPKSESNNSYLILLLIFMLIGILSYLILHFTDPNILFAIIFLLLLAASLITAIVMLVLWIASLIKPERSKKSNYTSYNSDFWLWLSSLIISIAITIPLLINPYYQPTGILLPLLFAIFSIAFLVFFIKWLIYKNSLKHNKIFNSFADNRLLLWLTFLSASALFLIINIYAYAAFSILQITIPFLFIGFIVTFIIWLVHLKDKPDPME